ncbi:LysM peptidoglycan-binding domain-containing protein [Streptomyces sp. IF17]|nr:transglycosylase family protein [Streptomyces alkaliphilus]MQS09372.1 LysM peptidoglycan-binding domain-containing protein [Streptomyces alkaliphilus]
MLSGSGRHRRPRQAPAFLVTAGVTGAGAALPLLGAGVAQAVDGETWDRVAQCESDGEWTADTGNGYYGGLQLPLKLWVEYGGQEFADTPDLASRGQQIAVAERILADQGPGAFPDCAHSGGLVEAVRQAREAEAAAERQAEAETAAPSRSRQISGIVDDAGNRLGSLPGTGTGSSAGERGATGSEAETSTGGRHRGAPDPNEAERLDEPASGRHAADRDTGEAERDGTSDRTSDTDGKATDPDATDRADTSDGSGGAGDPDRNGRGDRPERAGKDGGAGKPGGDATGGAKEAVADPSAYEVLPGDSLAGIADRQSVEGGWNALYRANEPLIGADPDRIVPGQVLSLDTSGVLGASGEGTETDTDAAADTDAGDEGSAGGAKG